MNPPEENTFILEEEIAPILPREESPKFSIIPHLAVIGLILFGIFSTVVIPKTLSYFNQGHINLPENIDVVVTASAIAPVRQIETVSVDAKAAFVWDLNNKEALYEKNANEALPLASITKLMTALVAYELVEDDTPITITASAASEQSGGTLQPGEVFRVKELADFALVTSYNSAAYMLADAVGRLLGEGTGVAQFTTGMNITAEEIGLDSMKFFNATGLDISATAAGAYGSARDVSLLVEHIYTKYPEILKPTTAPKTRLYNSLGQFHEANNTNEIISEIPNLLGSKTGYTDLAGGNLTVIFDAGFNRPIVITVLGSTRTERFSDMKKLIAATIATLNQE